MEEAGIFIQYIYLYVDNKFTENHEKNAEEIGGIFDEFSRNIEDLFNCMVNGARWDLEELRDFTRRIQSELKNTNAIIKNIVLYGSGNDVIYKDSLGKLYYRFCKIFIDNIINYYMGEKVLLNTNKECKIIQINVNYLCRLLLFDGLEFIDLKLERDLYVKKLIV
ncbi:hypothetical protein [Clostridium magnum]|uniref:Uncharacterized protein n=1 Tax=Clostridium magnum DSM 2767 TaxID=1121326 RepID=A0A162R8R1_9CLOT|nr:hypothetical protein [Clostridium magnum]KZL89579.1 hypothetical protein CLMAG_50790 [Clostridium magnum DSM 2767]SHH73075.1 hypothetical protein SAMN02745944_01263 [Clostridium magnum DSM 2767]